MQESLTFNIQDMTNEANIMFFIHVKKVKNEHLKYITNEDLFDFAHQYAGS